MTAPNDTTKFDTAFVVIWILLSYALLALACLRILPVPNLIKGPKILSFVFTGLQLVIWVLLLAALGRDDWSLDNSFPFFTTAYGVVTKHSPGKQDGSYYPSLIPSGITSDQKNLYNTTIAAGAFTLLFGLKAIFVSLALFIVVAFHTFGIVALRFLNQYVPLMANVQLISFQAMMFLWAVGAHNNLVEMFGASNIKLGPSWGLIFTVLLLSIPAALYFAGGPGEGGMDSVQQPAAGAAGTEIAPAPQQVVVVTQPVVVMVPQQQAEGSPAVAVVAEQPAPTA